MVLAPLLFVAPALILMAVTRSDAKMNRISQWIRTPATVFAVVGLFWTTYKILLS